MSEIVDEPDENEALDFGDEGDPADEQSEPLDLSATDRKLVTQPYDLGVKSLSSDIAARRIKLSIEYQRKYVWDSGKASRLIESLLLNVPIPVCYFAEDEDGSYEVIDGLQRLTTIRNFLENEFALTGLSVLAELNDIRFKDLAPRDQRRLENRTIRCIVITEESNPDIKFDVFERLNTGAATLTAQELRNSVYRGNFNDGLKVLAATETFTETLGTGSNKRMELEELVLRFFALAEQLTEYKPPLRQFLNGYMRTHRDQTPSDEQIAAFEATCKAVRDILGPTPFKGVAARNTVNKAIFDAIMIPFAFASKTDLLEHQADVKETIESLGNDDKFLTAIGRATADRQRMLYRIGIVADKLRELGVAVDLPEGLGIDEPLNTLTED